MDLKNKKLIRFNTIVDDIRKQNYQSNNKFLLTFFLMAACMELFDAGFDDPAAKKMLMVKFPLMPVWETKQILAVSRFIRTLSEKSCEACPPRPGERVEVSPECNGTGRWVPGLVFSVNGETVSVVQHLSGKIFTPALNQVRRLDRVPATEAFKHDGFRKHEKVSRAM